MTTTHRPKAGRPTRDQARARHVAMLETALDHFLNLGFEQTTIESIARSVGMTKRTIYARYPDKVALFHAAVGLAIDRFAVSQEQIEATERGDIEQTLIAFAWLRIEQVMTPNGLKLQRIINTEAYRFPQILAESYEIGPARRCASWPACWPARPRPAACPCSSPSARRSSSSAWWSAVRCGRSSSATS